MNAMPQVTVPNFGALLAPQAKIVVEHSPVEAPAFPGPHFHLADQRKYGKTLVSFIVYIL